MKIGVLGFIHESNSFVEKQTGIDDFNVSRAMTSLPGGEVHTMKSGASYKPLTRKTLNSSR